MDAVITSLGELLLRALPTLLLLLLLHLYLKWAFYGPLDRLLKRRWDATEGARKTAEGSLAAAEEKAAAYDRAIQEARAEIFQEIEEARRRREREQAAALGQARQESEQQVRDAKAALASEVEAAKRSLRTESEILAEEIAAAVLERRAV